VSLTFFIDNVRADERFSSLISISVLAKLMVDTTKHMACQACIGYSNRHCISGEVLFSNENCEDDVEKSYWRWIYE
jgi:hypothetical protein